MLRPSVGRSTINTGRRLAPGLFPGQTRLLLAAMANNPVIDLVDLLAQHRILDSGQLDEVRSFQRRYADPRLLFKELVLRGWLTAFQANHVLNGRAAELVLGS